MRKITELQYRKIIKEYNEIADLEASATATLMSSWGRNSEIDQAFERVEKKKNKFAKIFE